MTDPAAAKTPPPGWYQDAPDASGYRWWDGRQWTGHRTSGIGSSRVVQPPLAPGTSVQTIWIWLLSLVPLAVLAAEEPVLVGLGSLVHAQLEQQRQLLEHPGMLQPPPTGFDQLAALVAVDWVGTLLVLGLSVLAAFLDQRALRRRGIVRPFPWGWASLAGVYTVGRAVVVRRRTGRGMGPLWLAIGAFVLAMVVQLVQFLVVCAAVSQLPGS